MNVRRRHRLRIGLTAAAAMVFFVGAISCGVGLWVQHGDGAYRTRGASIVCGAFHLNYADRSTMAWSFSRPAADGWSCTTDRATGLPLTELLPGYDSQGPPAAGWFVRVPLWIPFLLLGAPAGWMWWQHARRQKHECESCGYDLRGARGATALR